MTSQHIAALARGIAPVLKDFMSGISARLAVLETKERIMGPPGPPGPRGEPGQDGRDGMSVQGLPGRDGADGKDGVGINGKDGLGFDDWDIRSDETGCYLRLEKGDRVKEKRLPIPYDRGTWDSQKGTTYEKGDFVSWNGSFWIAQRTTNHRPGTQGMDSGWRLAVKSGPEGKPGPQGPAGKDGRDLTNLGPDGAKWGR